MLFFDFFFEILNKKENYFKKFPRFKKLKKIDSSAA